MDAIARDKLKQLREGKLRAVGKQRRRLLHRRGIATWWDRDLMTYVWRP